jgi:hypothetical protein
VEGTLEKLTSRLSAAWWVPKVQGGFPSNLSGKRTERHNAIRREPSVFPELSYIGSSLFVFLRFIKKQ